MAASIDTFESYASRLGAVLCDTDWNAITPLADAMMACWKDRRQLFLAGNGGSAGNANHLANDFLYPVSKVIGSGIRAHALSTNAATLTCLANDEGYDKVFAAQLAVLANPRDLLIVFSGSGNSPNILAVLEEARKMSVESFAILGFDGGKALALADHAIHFPVDDMQISEDLQMIVCNMVLQHLYTRRHEAAVRPEAK